MLARAAGLLGSPTTTAAHAAAHRDRRPLLVSSVQEGLGRRARLVASLRRKTRGKLASTRRGGAPAPCTAGGDSTGGPLASPPFAATSALLAPLPRTPLSCQHCALERESAGRRQKSCRGAPERCRCTAAQVLLQALPGKQFGVQSCLRSPQQACAAIAWPPPPAAARLPAAAAIAPHRHAKPIAALAPPLKLPSLTAAACRRPTPVSCAGAQCSTRSKPQAAASSS